MTKIYIIKDLKEGKYFLYINALGMNELEPKIAERFISVYNHVKPTTVNDKGERRKPTDKDATASQYMYTNP